MTRIGAWISLLVGCFTAACAGSGGRGTVNGSEAAAADTCASVARGVAPATVERLERASNVLEYERIWQTEHSGTAPGSISGSEVRARIRSHNAEIQACYESALDKLPSGSGRVVVRFIVGSSGNVPAVSITSNDFEAPEVGCCVAKHIAAWNFPNPTNGDFIVVEYPFVVRTMK